MRGRGDLLHGTPVETDAGKVELTARRLALRGYTEP